MAVLYIYIYIYYILAYILHNGDVSFEKKMVTKVTVDTRENQ